MKQQKGWTEFKEYKAKIPLPNPATFDFQGILVYFQVFLVVDDEEEQAAPSPPTSPDLKLSIIGEPKPQARATRKFTRGTKSYAVMIEQALRQYNGQATYKEIIEYIKNNFADQVVERRTWRNSVGGVLSSNPLFRPAQGGQPLSDKTRGRGAVWCLTEVANRNNPSNIPSSNVDSENNSAISTPITFDTFTPPPPPTTSAAVAPNSAPSGTSPERTAPPSSTGRIHDILNKSGHPDTTLSGNNNNNNNNNGPKPASPASPTSTVGNNSLAGNVKIRSLLNPDDEDTPFYGSNAVVVGNINKRNDAPVTEDNEELDDEDNDNENDNDPENDGNDEEDNSVSEADDTLEV